MDRNDIQLTIIALLTAGLLLAIFLGARHRSPDPPTIVVKHTTDTLYLHDTISVSTPVYLTRRVVERDTVRLHDTLFVVLDREQVEWRDSLATVWASGVRPSVDSVRHYVTERIVTNTVTVEKVRKTRWGVGVQAGVGAGKDGLTPYIGAGVTYNILAW